jgi:hypothetical protein
VFCQCREEVLSYTETVPRIRGGIARGIFFKGPQKIRRTKKKASLNNKYLEENRGLASFQSFSENTQIWGMLQKKSNEGRPPNSKGPMGKIPPPYMASPALSGIILSILQIFKENSIAVTLQLFFV